MNLTIYQVDAFTDRLFAGNPAAVCPLADRWPDDRLMLDMARENNLSETAFYIRRDDGYHIRWFTPAVEVDLCGHATLAAAHVLFEYEGHSSTGVSFGSRSGPLGVRKEGGWLVMDFPVDVIRKIDTSGEIASCFDIAPVETYRGKTDYLLIFRSENDILALKPDLGRIARLDARGVIVSARGSECDFVSRFFAPRAGVDEDPVTGSAHTTLVPYWRDILGKSEFSAVQLSARRGFLRCRDRGERTEIAGKAVLYMRGEVRL
ncbi:MAG: PhzF family phenazine biosynthesis protein [Spirochaetes bacterium]|jgi:predicted PhzF superfamily epimerase YddE/YHI9|nr:PhzF family phenazine biosynthesis protein [Spirochaetota bacterium]